MIKVAAKLAAGILLTLLLLIMLTGYLVGGEALSHLPALAVVCVMLVGAVKMAISAWRELKSPKPKAQEESSTTWEQDEPWVVCGCCGAEGAPDRYGCCVYCGSPIDQ